LFRSQRTSTVHFDQKLQHVIFPLCTLKCILHFRYR
jgi:hypothetical protein